MFEQINERITRKEILNEAHQEEMGNQMRECTRKALILETDIMHNRMEGKNFDSLFNEFYKQCFMLNILCEWHNETPEEKEECKEFFELCGHGLFAGKTQDRLKESYDDMERDEENPKIVRFVEIIQTTPEDITKEMKLEAVNLFPCVVWELGVFY